MIDFPSAEQVPNGQINTFLEHLPAIRAEPQAAHIGDVGSGGEQCDYLTIPEYRGDYRKVVEVSCTVPGIVGHQDITGLKCPGRMLAEEKPDTCGHCIDVAGSPGNSLGQHMPIGIKDAGR